MVLQTFQGGTTESYHMLNFLRTQISKAFIHKNLKKFITDYCKNNGSYLKNRFTGDIENTLENGCLYEKYLLVPVKKILVCERWGYDRDGTNSVSRPIDFDLSVNIEKYKVLEKFEIAFIVIRI